MNGIDILERDQPRVTNLMKRLEHLSNEERLRALRLFSLGKAQEDLINIYKYLKGGCKEDKTKWFPVTGPEAMSII